MAENKTEIGQDTLDLMVLTILMTSLRCMATRSRGLLSKAANALEINQGTSDASLVRRQQRRWTSAVRGSSEESRGEPGAQISVRELYVPSPARRPAHERAVAGGGR